MIGLFRSLAASLRRLLQRRAARRLAALGLPRGLPAAPPPPVRTALRMPPPFEAPAGEFWTVPLGARLLRGQPPLRLFRLAALPRPLRRLDVLRAPRTIALPRAPRLPARLDLSPRLRPLVLDLGVARDLAIAWRPPAPRLPARLARAAGRPLAAPLAPVLRDLGVARPALFRLDDELRLPVERDPLRIAPDAPPLAQRRALRPRTPLARAPLDRYDPRAFRIDPRTLSPANENAAGLKEPYPGLWWVNPRLRREKVDLPWMARRRIAFLGPLHYEWFVLWWDQNERRSPGARDGLETRQPAEVFWALEECKEQMLIRRDVGKDENAPPLQEFFIIEQGVAMLAYEPEDLGSLIPEKQWVEISKPVPPPPLWDRPPREVYLQWRTLMDGLAER